MLREAAFLRYFGAKLIDRCKISEEFTIGCYLITLVEVAGDDFIFYIERRKKIFRIIKMRRSAFLSVGKNINLKESNSHHVKFKKIMYK